MAVWDKNMLYRKILKIILLLLFINIFQNCYCQILWEDQLIFKTHLYDKTGEMNGYVLIYAPEHKKLIALDAQTGEPIKTEYNLKGKELFLNTPKDKFIKKQILFFAKQKENKWQLEIYHFTRQKITLTGKPFQLPQNTREILSLKYKNGYIYYLYETKDSSLVLERKHIQCTAVGLPTFSNETSELYYDSSIDGFLILPHFAILPDGLDATKDIVMLVARGRRVKAKVFARMADCETLPSHTIVKLPDKHVSLTPPRGTSFPTVILHGTRQKGYDICLVGRRRNQTRVYMRRMGKNDIEIDELEMIPIMGGNLYCQPFWIRGNWWFPIKESQGIKLIFYSEMQGGKRFSSNYFDCSNLYLMSDPRNARLLYGLSKDSWRKYALSYSLNDWKKYGGFRSLQFGKKSLYTLPSNIAMGKKIKEFEPAQVTGAPYLNNNFSLKPIEKIEIEFQQGHKAHFTYLTTKEKMDKFILTRKYCLLYNDNFYPRSPVNSSMHYEYHLCWEASYGSDNSIKGFYLTYQGEKVLLVKVANQIYKVSCTKNNESRIQPFSFENIEIIGGIYDKEWYKKDLADIQKIKFLDRINNRERYLIITQKNIYQAIIEKDTIKLVESMQVTGPIKQIYFSHLSQDNSTLYCGGVSKLNRTFLAELLLLPESKQNKYPTFSGSIYNYVQNIRTQYIRRPKKIISRGNIVYILNYKGQIEAYEKVLGSFSFSGGIKLNSKILDISLIDNTLCLLTKNQLYCLNLSMQEIGTSLQSHFDKNNIPKILKSKIVPVKLTKNKEFLFVHFPKILQCLKIKNSSIEKESLLVNSDNIIQAGFHIIKGSKGDFYIAANKKLFKYTKLQIFKEKLQKPWLTIDTNICQLFYDKGVIYYLSRDGQIGGIKE